MVLEFGSPAFDEFLDCIGQRVSLQGFTGYRGGLDCKSTSRSTNFFNETRSFLFTLHVPVLVFECSSLCRMPMCANTSAHDTRRHVHCLLHHAAGSTGAQSLYTQLMDYEIMFHVSTLLPYTPTNRQQVLQLSAHACKHNTNDMCI